MVLLMPYLRAQATILRAVGPSLTPPSPTSPRKRTPAEASSSKSCSSIPGSITGAPACTFTPLARKFEKQRCAVIAIALSPTMSRGRPGVWTSPADTIVVTPPCRQESIQLSWLCRGVQSPATGWTWLSIRPGASATPWASVVVRRRGAGKIEVRGAPDCRDAAVDSDDRVRVENRLLEVAAQHQPDVLDRQLDRRACRSWFG